MIHPIPSLGVTATTLQIVDVMVRVVQPPSFWATDLDGVCSFDRTFQEHDHSLCDSHDGILWGGDLVVLTRASTCKNHFAFTHLSWRIRLRTLAPQARLCRWRRKFHDLYTELQWA